MRGEDFGGGSTQSDPTLDLPPPPRQAGARPDTLDRLGRTPAQVRRAMRSFAADQWSNGL